MELKLSNSLLSSMCSFLLVYKNSCSGQCLWMQRGSLPATYPLIYRMSTSIRQVRQRLRPKDQTLSPRPLNTQEWSLALWSLSVTISMKHLKYTREHPSTRWPHSGKTLTRSLHSWQKGQGVLEEQEGHTHWAFPNLNADILKPLEWNREDFLLWMKKYGLKNRFLFSCGSVLPFLLLSLK